MVLETVNCMMARRIPWKFFPGFWCLMEEVTFWANEHGSVAQWKWNRFVCSKNEQGTYVHFELGGGTPHVGYNRCIETLPLFERVDYFVSKKANFTWVERREAFVWYAYASDSSSDELLFAHNSQKCRVQSHQASHKALGCFVPTYLRHLPLGSSCRRLSEVFGRCQNVGSLIP